MQSVYMFLSTLTYDENVKSFKPSEKYEKASKFTLVVSGLNKEGYALFDKALCRVCFTVGQIIMI